MVYEYIEILNKISKAKWQILFKIILEHSYTTSFFYAPVSCYFDVHQFFFIGIIALIFIVLIINIIKGIITWNYNNSQPRLTVNTKVMARRQNVSAHTQYNENNMSSVHANTSYFLTFEIESGDRMEFKVKSN